MTGTGTTTTKHDQNGGIMVHRYPSQGAQEVQRVPVQGEILRPSTQARNLGLGF